MWSVWTCYYCAKISNPWGIYKSHTTAQCLEVTISRIDLNLPFLRSNEGIYGLICRRQTWETQKHSPSWGGQQQKNSAAQEFHGIPGRWQWNQYTPLTHPSLQVDLLAVNYLVQALALEPFRQFLTNERPESWWDQWEAWNSEQTQIYRDTERHIVKYCHQRASARQWENSTYSRKTNRLSYIWIWTLCHFHLQLFHPLPSSPFSVLVTLQIYKWIWVFEWYSW